MRPLFLLPAPYRAQTLRLAIVHEISLSAYQRTYASRHLQHKCSVWHLSAEKGVIVKRKEVPHETQAVRIVVHHTARYYAVLS